MLDLENVYQYKYGDYFNMLIVFAFFDKTLMLTNNEHAQAQLTSLWSMMRGEFIVPAKGF